MPEDDHDTSREESEHAPAYTPRDRQIADQMRILDIFKPNTATLEFGHRVFNLVYRVVFTTVAIVALGALAIGIGHAANLGAQAAGAIDTIKQYVKNGSAAFYVVTVTVSWLFAATDPVRLALLNFSNRRPDDDNSDHKN